MELLRARAIFSASSPDFPFNSMFRICCFVASSDAFIAASVVGFCFCRTRVCQSANVIFDPAGRVSPFVFPASLSCRNVFWKSS